MKQEASLLFDTKEGGLYIRDESCLSPDCTVLCLGRYNSTSLLAPLLVSDSYCIWFIHMHLNICELFQQEFPYLTDKKL
jgi:hypothetical protein